MKKNRLFRKPILLLSLLAVLLTWGQTAWGQATLPTSWSGGWSSTTLPTGWSKSGLAADYSENDYDGSGGDAAKLDGTGDYIQIYFGSQASSVSYWIVGKGFTNGTFTVQESSNGSTWTTLRSFTAPSPSATATQYTETPLSATRYIRFYFTTKNTGNIGLDGINITAPACTSPTTQATSFSTNTITATSMNIAFTRGNGDGGVMVVMKSGTAPTDPSSGTTYAVSAACGGGTVVYNGTAAGTGNATGNIAISSLTANTIYHFAVYEYNSSGTCYNLTQLTGSATTLCASPTTQSSGLTFSAVTSTSMTISWTGGNGTNKAVFIKEGAGAITNPVDGTTYTASTNWSSKGTQLGTSGYYCVYNSTGMSVSLTNLNPNSTYYVQVFGYNCSGASSVFNVSTATNNPNNTTTLCSEPTTSATAVTFTSVTSTSMTVNWVRGTTPGDGVIVLMKSASAVSTAPSDATTYTASNATPYGTLIATGNYVVYMGTGTSVNITDLTPGTAYYFAVYEYNCTGATSNFKTTAPATGNKSTLCTTPTVQASNITFSNVLNNSMTVGWTNGTGGTRRIVIMNTSNSFTNPIDGTDPSANATYGGSGEQVVYNGTGTSFNVSGLTTNTTYWFRVYEANCSGATISFITSTATDNPLSNTTLSNPAAVLANNGTQITAASVYKGQTNIVLHKFQLTVSNANTTLSGLQCITGGTYLLADVTNFKAWYSSDATFDSGSDLLLSTYVNAGAAATITFPTFTSQAINSGSVGYIFITCDIPSTATSAKTVSVNAITTSHPTFAVTTEVSGSTTTGGTQTIAVSNTSDVVAVTSSESNTISSLINDAAPLTSITGAQVWEITIRDGGATNNDLDNLPTKVSAITFSENASDGTSTWFTLVKTAALFDGSTFIATASSITATTIVFSGLSVSVADNTNKTLSLRLSFNSPLGTGNDDGEDIVLSLTNANFTTVADGTSSTKASFTTASSTDTKNAIAVTATELRFVQQPSSTVINATMSPAVTIQATDANGNRDLNSAATVSLTSDGTMTAVTDITLTNGFGTFGNIVHTAIATGRKLTATASGLTNALSSTFDIIQSTIILSSTDPAVVASSIAQSATKQPIYKFTTAVTVANTIINSVSFTTTNTAASDIVNYKLWFKTSDALGTATQIGSSITTSLETGTHTFSGLTQAISSGTTGYFWITVDVAAGAVAGNTITTSAITTTDITFAQGSLSGTAYAGGLQTIIDAPINIPDNGCATSNYATKTFTYTGGVTSITDINAFVSITHPYRADLEIKLVAPNSTEIDLLVSSGSGADNLEVIFDDAGIAMTTNAHLINDVADETIVTTGTGADLLSTFNGLNPAGVWTLKVCDNSGTDIGTLNNFNVIITGASNDVTSIVTTSTTLTEPLTISSLIDTDGEKIQVFDFTFTDDDSGADDGLATIIDQFLITKGSANQATDWTTAIGGASITGPDGTFTGSVTANNITFAGADFISIASGASETYTLSIWLKPTLYNGADDDILEFKVSYTDITEDVAGSAFGSGAPESGDLNVAIAVTATELRFVQQPSSTVINATMSPAVTIQATDANGNRDLNSAATVSLTSDGTMTAVTDITLTNGFGTFGNIVHTLIQNSRKLTATSTGLTNVLSNTFNIINVAYCNPAPTSVDGNGITNVTMGTINNTTGKETNNYGNYSALSTNVTQGETVSCAITYSTGYTYGTKIWVDWNDDGDFIDAGEEVYSGTSLADNPTTLATSFTVPITASLGIHRLRIGGADSATPTPCYTGTFASYEDYTINVNAACSGPTTQATVFATNNVTSTSLNYSFTRGNGNMGVMVVMKSGSAPTDPTNGTAYALNAACGGGTVIYNSNAIAINTTTGNIAKTGLTAATTYHFAVYEYNDDGGTPCYHLTQLTGSITTLCGTPTTNATTMTFSNVLTTTMTVGWTSGNGTNRILVARKGSQVDWAPEDFVEYTANSSFSSGTGYGTSTDNFVVYNGSAATVNITNLTSGATYYFVVYEYRCTGISTDYLTDSPLTSSKTTAPSPITNLKVLCTTSTTAEISWNLPVGDFGGILIVADAGEDPATPTCDGGDLISANTNYGSALVYCANAKGSKYLFNGTDTKLSISGLTPSTSYTFAAFVYKEDGWSAITKITVSSVVNNVTNFTADCGNLQSTLIWTNPNILCFAEVIIVAKYNGVVTSVPSTVPATYGAYNGNASFNAGTQLNAGEYIVYKGTGNNVTVTNLTPNDVNSYYFKAFVRVANVWSSGVEVSCKPTTAIKLGYGDLAIVGINTYNASNKDEIQFLSFVDITTKTKIDLTDNGYERKYVGKWGEGEGRMRITRTGATLPAGTIICIRGSSSNYNFTDWTIRIDANNDGDFEDAGDIDNANWSISGEGPFDLNVNDQIWIMQGGEWIDGGTHKWDYSGKVLYGWTATGWKSTYGYDDTKGSTLVPGAECSNTNVTSVTFQDKVKYNGAAVSDATQRDWLSRINNSTNWSGWDLDAGYEAGGTLRTCPIKNRIGILGGGFSSLVKWTGEKNTNWYECVNWLNLRVPNEASNIIFVADDCTRDLVIQTSETPICNDFTISGAAATHKFLMEGSDTKVLTVYGDLTIGLADVFDFDDGTAANDGKIIIYGDWINNAGANGFLEGNSHVTFIDDEQQYFTNSNIETFYKLKIDNSSSEGVTMTSGDIVITSDFELSKSSLNLNGNDLTISGIYSRTNGVFKGHTTSNMLINGSGTLSNFYFATPQLLANFTNNRATKAVLATNLDVNTDMYAQTGAIEFSAGKEFTINNLKNDLGAAGLIIKSDFLGTASVKQTTGPVEATVERYMTSDIWHFFYPTLSTIPVTQYKGTSTSGNYVFIYEESFDDFWNATDIFGVPGWQEIKTGNVTTAKGSIYTDYNNRLLSLTGGTLKDNDATFTVTYNVSTSPANIPIGGFDPATGYSYLGCVNDWTVYDGWNLIGNPYACAIDWSLMGDDTDIENGIYMYDGTVNKYKYYIKTGSANALPININQDGGVGNNVEHIPAGQAFFVKAEATAGTTGSITILKSMRTHTTHDYWKSPKQINPDLLRFEISNGSYTDETVVFRVDGSTENHDGEFDLYKRYSWESGLPQIYTYNEFGNQFALNSFPTIGVSKQIPIGIYVGVNGNYSINFKENTYNNVNILLEDKSTTPSSFTNIVTSPIYNFSSDKGLITDRFVLHFNQNTPPQAVADIRDFIVVKETNFELDYNNSFVDIDLHDILTIDATLSDGSSLPAWLSCVNNKLVGVPHTEDIGVYNILLTASDLSKATASIEFSITVTNIDNPPTLNLEIADFYTDVNQNFSFSIPSNTFVDMESEKLTYSATSQDDIFAQWLTFDPTTLMFSGKANKAGEYLISVSAKDAAEQVVTDNFSIFVKDANTIFTSNFTLSVYPNPTEGKFVVYLPSDLQSTLTVTDLLGHVVKQYVNMGNDKLEIDLSYCAKGVYNLQIKIAEQTFTQKIILK